MKTLIGALTILASLTNLDAQLIDHADQLTPNLAYAPFPAHIAETQDQVETVGSQLLYDEFYPARFKIVNDKKIYAAEFFRYNIYYNEILVKYNDQFFKLLVSEIQEFEISANGQKREFFNASEIPGVNANGFLEKIYANNGTVIYFMHEIKVRIRDTAVPYDATKDQIIYQNRKLTFIEYEGRVFEVYNRKDLKEFLPAEILKSEKIRPKDLEDVNFLKSLGDRISKTDN